MLFKALTFILLLSAWNSFVECNEKLPVGIFYESLCPDSVNFITNQLNPAFDEVSPYVDVHFVPFGKSFSVNEGESFECQHGPAECSGNKIQSCVLARLEGNAALEMKFVACQMSRGADATGRTCSDAVGADWDAVQQCYNSDEGVQLQLQAEQYTIAIAPQFVPTIVYNKQFDQNLQDSSLHNFKGVVCSQLTVDPLPDFC